MFFNAFLRKLAGFLALYFSLAVPALAYEVEADSTANTVYLLLNNTNLAASFDSVTVGENSPAFVSASSVSIVPATVPANGSELAALEFDIAPGTLIGTTGNLVITASGSVGSQPHQVVVVVPLEVVDIAESAQGVVGGAVPVADVGGTDSDGDGVSDLLEQAFGSDAFYEGSLPGGLFEVPIPLMGTVGNALLALVFLSIGLVMLKQGFGNGGAVMRTPLGILVITLAVLSTQNSISGSAVRIQLVVDIPIPVAAPPATLLSATATASSVLGAGGAYQAVDGNLLTRWESNHGVDPSWITLDLGSVHTLTQTVIHWEAANAGTYRMEGSNDNSSWVTIAEETGGLFGNRTDTVALSGSYRYLRMYGVSRSPGNVYGYSIFEMEVYGYPTALTDGDGDGVIDSEDLCPATATLAVNSSGCVAIDSDSDGVDDVFDLCPSTPMGSTVDAEGCISNAVLLSATATASSQLTGAASLAVDGSMATRWESAHGTDPSWITLDLGGAYDLANVIIHWEAANAATYEIQGSSDNNTWITLSSQTGGVFGDRTDDVAIAGDYRYVRMHGLTRAAGPGGAMYGYSIYEMEVYGEPAADADGDGISDSADLCPGTPPGSNVDASGCIVLDSDGDGVLDTADLCPGTATGATVDATGCEIIIPVNEVTSINDILAGGVGSSQPGLTLYVFDNDPVSGGVSNCNGGCATSWPPLLVGDGVASGVSGLGTITRADSTTQATHNGRPLYYFAGDSVVGDTNGDGLGGVWHTVSYIQLFTPLFDNTTVLEPALQEDTGSALITRLADRARDRHAREAQFQSYDHFLSFYWEHRTAEIEIIDTIAHGGTTITFNVITEWPVNTNEAELRFFHLQAAVYANNGIMTAQPQLDDPATTRKHYTRSVTSNPLTGQPLQVGDRMEFELSQFLTGTPNGRDNYYGTAILYVVGQGVEPFEAENPSLVTGLANVSQNPYPMPAAGRLGGDTTLNYQYSDEPDNHFMQMPTNLSNINGQTFVLGRRVHHTDFGDGSHDEAADNAGFAELANTLGTNYINRSCIACHAKNGRAIPPTTGQPLDQYVVKVGDASGAPDAQIGAILQPKFTAGSSEGSVSISSWTEDNGLRSPVYAFTGVTPSNFSARIAPQLVGLGLLEAIEEDDLVALADEADSNGDGISGRLSLVADAVSSETRIGRFGWKASQPTVKQQVAAALNGDIGVMTSIMPNPDCGTSQSNCGNSGAELSDQRLEELSAYISLLGVSARRDITDPVALQGEALFNATGCGSCHVDTFQTSPYHPHAELRDQTIHPYTDLLLHDMGPGLASTLIEVSAAGSEWRTPPLWNIGLTSGVSGGEGYLHDGRARTLHEAIMWHGGEGEASKNAYDALSQADKDAVIAFLNSL